MGKFNFKNFDELCDCKSEVVLMKRFVKSIEAGFFYEDILSNLESVNYVDPSDVIKSFYHAEYGIERLANITVVDDIATIKLLKSRIQTAPNSGRELARLYQEFLRELKDKAENRGSLKHVRCRQIPWIARGTSSPKNVIITAKGSTMYFSYNNYVGEIDFERYKIRLVNNLLYSHTTAKDFMLCFTVTYDKLLEIAKITNEDHFGAVKDSFVDFV